MCDTLLLGFSSLMNRLMALFYVRMKHLLLYFIIDRARALLYLGQVLCSSARMELLMVEHTNRQAETLSKSSSSTCSPGKHRNGRQYVASVPLLSFMLVLVMLVVVLAACGGSSGAPTSQATSTTSIKKHTTGCTPQATLPANVGTPPAAFDSGANVITNFNFARQQEGCTVSLNIDTTAYDAATPQMQMLLLFNAERQDRGLPALQLDSTLLSQIDLNHSKEFVQYKYFAHPSPINQPGGKTDSSSRITVNPAVKGQFCCAEIIAAGQSTAAEAVYDWMYQDADSSWGHRQNILGYNSNVDANAGHYTWVGIGIATGGSYGVYYTADFLEDTAGTPYSPPNPGDTQAPTLNPPTVVDANTVQVTGVQDNSDGGTSTAGVSSVVFYIGSAVAADGSTFQTVVATQSTTGTWTATLAVSDPTTLHVVVVDGSGNYTDCVGGGTTC